jgi:hypothetical protein
MEIFRNTDRLQRAWFRIHCLNLAHAVQLYHSSHPSTFAVTKILIAFQWSMAIRLFINSSKSQAMIINPYLSPIDVLPQIRLGADVIPCYKILKNLGLLINKTSHGTSRSTRYVVMFPTHLDGSGLWWTTHKLKQEGN